MYNDIINNILSNIKIIIVISILSLSLSVFCGHYYYENLLQKKSTYKFEFHSTLINIPNMVDKLLNEKTNLNHREFKKKFKFIFELASTFEEFKKVNNINIDVISLQSIKRPVSGLEIHFFEYKEKDISNVDEIIKKFTIFVMSETLNYYEEKFLEIIDEKILASEEEKNLLSQKNKLLEINKLDLEKSYYNHKYLNDFNQLKLNEKIKKLNKEKINLKEIMSQPEFFLQNDLNIKFYKKQYRHKFIYLFFSIIISVLFTTLFVLFYNFKRKN
jgi:hypothetical protein